MPNVLYAVQVGRPPDIVFPTIKDIERFPDFVKDVKSISILHRQSPAVWVSQWNIDVDGTSISWTEEDIVDDNLCTLSFRLIDGDYKYHGVWKVESVDSNSSKISVYASFDWEVPNFEKYFGSVYEHKARLALRGMLIALKNRINHG